MRAMTVAGPVAAEELGTTLLHEHVLLDFSCRYTGTGSSAEVAAPLALRERWRLLQEPAAHRANLDRTDRDEAVFEVSCFAAAGGRTIVDATTVGLGPDWPGLRAVSAATGVHLVAATGWYVHRSHSAWQHERSVEQLAEMIVTDLEVGHDGIRAGFIGEIGVDGPEACEVRALRAAAQAQQQTGAPVAVHVLSGVLPEHRPSTVELVAEYRRSGGDPERLIVCHQDGSGDDLGYQEALLDQGVLLAYDTFGFASVFRYGSRHVQLPTDTQRIAELARLVERGWSRQLVVSQDICYRMMTRSWGGWGFAHLLDTLRPRFLAAGFDEPLLHQLLVATPARLLAYLP